MTRTFIALPVWTHFMPSSLLREVTRNLYAKLPNRIQQSGFTPERQHHITVRFLGETNEEQLSSLVYQSGLRECAKGFFSIHLELDGEFGVFPNRDDPRVVYAGVKGDLTELAFIRQRIDHLAEDRLGFSKAGHPLTPHITIARIGDLTEDAAGRLRVIDAVDNLKMEDWPEETRHWTARRLELLASVRYDFGVVYETLTAARLGNEE